tara:strand:+ start:6586 stop:7692 length:1107 start_codon:yes stop_codon:yes gene_type:complete
MTLSTEQLKRYARHLSLAEVGVNGQTALSQARVLCVGAGGLGSAVLPYLAASGIGYIGIVDGDKVELSNLQRQILFTETDIGQPKAQVAAKRLIAMNADLNVQVHDEFLTEDNAFDILADYDIVVDGSDNFFTRYLINDVCWFLKKPNIAASILQFEGQCSIYTAPNGPCFRCLYPEPPSADAAPNCAEAGVLGVLPGWFGIVQATEVVKIILGLGESLVGRLLIYDALQMRTRELSIAVDPECPLCGKQQAFETLPRTLRSCDMSVETISANELNDVLADVTLVDVREPHEYEICHLLNATLIPLGEIAERYAEIDSSKPIVVYCKSGFRSEQAAVILQQVGVTNVRNLTGGIFSWIDSVDSSLEKY